MKKQTPLAVESDEFDEVQEPPPSGDAWALGTSATCSVALKDAERGTLADRVAAFLASGGTIVQVAPGVTSMRLECTKAVYDTKADGQTVQREYRTFVSRDMTRRELDRRNYAHLKESVRGMLDIGFSVEQIASVMSASVGQIQRAIEELKEGAA